MITIDLQDDEVKPVKRKQRRERDMNRRDNDRRWKSEPTMTGDGLHNAGNPGLIARILKVFFKEA